MCDWNAVKHVNVYDEGICKNLSRIFGTGEAVDVSVEGDGLPEDRDFRLFGHGNALIEWFTRTNLWFYSWCKKYRRLPKEDMEDLETGDEPAANAPIFRPGSTCATPFPWYFIDLLPNNRRPPNPSYPLDVQQLQLTVASQTPPDSTYFTYNDVHTFHFSPIPMTASSSKSTLHASDTAAGDVESGAVPRGNGSVSSRIAGYMKKNGVPSNGLTSTRLRSTDSPFHQGSCDSTNGPMVV